MRSIVHLRNLALQQKPLKRLLFHAEKKKRARKPLIWKRF
jgi:hypothetical protein